MPNIENKKSKVAIWFPVIVSIALAGGIYLGLQINKKTNTSYAFQEDQSSGQGTIEEILRYIESRYVKKIDRKDLVEATINNLLDELDPHSAYISKNELDEVNEQLQGNFDGIGIQYTILDDTLFVIKPIKNGPSEKVGIKKGDRIVEIEGSPIVGESINIEEIISKLKGQAGTKVSVKVLRKGHSELLPFTITRATIADDSVEIGYMIDDETAYFKIKRFSESTYREFMNIIENLSMNHGLKNLVIDLRQNPGGYLQEATKLLNQFFVEKDKLLVYTEGASVRKSEYRTTGKSFFDINDICVLIDDGSASASEIVAGALQDLDRATIIGRRSFGKGLVQEQYNLSDGSALRLTVAKYFIPSGRCIQRTYKAGHNKYDHDYLTRLESGEFTDSTKMEYADTVKYYTSKGREVHGGGGIRPDFFVPLDTVYTNKFVADANPFIQEFAFRYAETHNLSNFKDADSYVNSFEFSQDDLTAFYDFLKRKKVEIPTEISPTVQQFLATNIKAILGKYLFDEEVFFKIQLENDADFKKAMEVIESHQQIVERLHAQ